jgi:tRNA (adenine37-N6)-methyltransferase
MDELAANSGCFQVNPIGYIESCFTEKFGIPRQSGLVPAATARLQLVAPFNTKEMVRGLAGFSHLWLHFVFHKSMQRGWKQMVRPPRLGGNRKVGVFASRSPQRPNFLGMSVVSLTSVLVDDGQVCLDLSGVDLLNGTPVIDIKPYLPYADCIGDACGGYAKEPPVILQVHFADCCFEFCHLYQEKTGRDLLNLLNQLLALDPRPAYQREKEREYGMPLWDVNIIFSIAGQCVKVNKLESTTLGGCPERC